MLSLTCLKHLAREEILRKTSQPGPSEKAKILIF